MLSNPQGGVNNDYRLRIDGYHIYAAITEERRMAA